MMGTLCVNGRLGTDVYPLSSDGEGEAGNGPPTSINGLTALYRITCWAKTRLAGLEPTASASAGLRSIQLSYKRSILRLLAVAAVGLQVRHVLMWGVHSIIF